MIAPASPMINWGSIPLSDLNVLTDTNRCSDDGSVQTSSPASSIEEDHRRATETENLRLARRRTDGIIARVTLDR